MALDGLFRSLQKGAGTPEKSPALIVLSVRRVCPLPYRLIILLYEPSALFTT